MIAIRALPILAANAVSSMLRIRKAVFAPYVIHRVETIESMRQKTSFEGEIPLKGRLITKYCGFSFFLQTTSCVSTVFVENLCYDAITDSEERRITATVASSPDSGSAESRILAAISRSGS